MITRSMVWILACALLWTAAVVSAGPIYGSRGGYPKCIRGRKTGMAHYRGWKIVGDDLSGGLPVAPAYACAQTCSKYGQPCSGVSYSDTLKSCFLKGDSKGQWKFKRSMNREDGVDLIGSCGQWAGIVPADMDASCCRG